MLVQCMCGVGCVRLQCKPKIRTSTADTLHLLECVCGVHCRYTAVGSGGVLAAEEDGRTQMQC